MPGARLNVVASLRHYLDHVMPVVRNVKGALLCCPPSSPARERAEIEGLCPRNEPVGRGGLPVLVAAHRDMTRLHESKRVAYLEHGAGQTYADLPNHPGFAGGDGWDGTSLFLVPGPNSAKAWRARYPDARVVELRGSPRLDAWAAPDGTPVRARGGGTPTVAFAFHWGCRLTRETDLTWPEWAEAIRGLGRHFRLIGHGHPRVWHELSAVWRRLDVITLPNFTDVLDRADLLVVDNSSVAYEFAGTGKPVLLLDSRTYRRDVNHGLRFWNAAPGLRCSEPRQLRQSIELALEDPAAARRFRDKGVRAAYGGYPDGRATERAVDAIEDWLDGDL